MTLSLAQTQAITALARHLYCYLPGSSQYRVFTFAQAANEAGVEPFWVPGSKLPALTGLLERTLDQQSSVFCRLLQIIVREGLKYRAKSGEPMTKEDLAELNELIRAVGYKIPDLWDPVFRASLPAESRTADAVPVVEQTIAKTPDQAKREERYKTLERLEARFLELGSWSDRQAAGRELERLLHDLFGAYDLQPRGAFVIVGEQIDGSIVLDSNSYLVEAKWEKSQVGLEHLAVFREKVTAKSAFTRGVFISISGYGPNAVSAITTGRQPNFLMLDGVHLFSVLHGDRDLVEMLHTLVRELADKGRPYVPLSELPQP